MPRIVEGKNCPTCGHDKGTVQKFEIPEIAVLDTESLNKGIVRIEQGIQAGFGGLKLDIEKMTPKEQTDYCHLHPEQCEHKAHADTLETELATLKKEAENITMTPELTAKMIEHAKTCPNCKAPLDQHVAAEIKAGGYVKPGPAATPDRKRHSDPFLNTVMR